MSIERETYGQLPGGESVEKFVLRNSRGIRLSVISYGGIITSLEMPGRNGTQANITLGLETLADYLAGHPYFGSLVGRQLARAHAALVLVEVVNVTTLHIAHARGDELS